MSKVYVQFSLLPASYLHVTAAGPLSTEVKMAFLDWDLHHQSHNALYLLPVVSPCLYLWHLVLYFCPFLLCRSLTLLIQITCSFASSDPANCGCGLSSAVGVMCPHEDKLLSRWLHWPFCSPAFSPFSSACKTLPFFFILIPLRWMPSVPRRV